MTRPDGERIATLEQHMLDQDRKLNEIQLDIKEIKLVLQAQPSLREEINQLKTQVIEVKQKQGVRLWVERAITGESGPVLTILVLSYLDKLK